MKKFFSLLASAALAVSVNASAQDFSSNNYIEQYGRLKLVGKQLSSESGAPVLLRGWSSFGWMSNWGDCHDYGHLEQMKKWGASIYRGAMYVEEGGYNNNKVGFTQQTKTFIDQTAKLGMYYLCDWHVLTPGDPNGWAYNDAKNYFDEISKYVKSKGYKHVIYEICNEPNGVTWNDIKTYADKVLPTIAANDPGACVVVGTPQWDQDIHLAAQSPITKYNGQLNLLYSFHYYSCSHQQFLSRLENAANSIPCFISEWGIADFSGGAGSRDVPASCYTSADALMNIANGSKGQKISWCAWAFGQKNEQASSLMSCGSMELSPTGKKIVELLGGDTNVKPTISACYANSCHEIKSDMPSVVDLGKYDNNPDGGKEDMGFGKFGDKYVGGSEGVTYHEENTTDDEVNNRSKCNGAYKWSGADYSFREDECVDVSGCYGITGSEGWHNLGYVEPGEWLIVTVDVEKAGYYSLRVLCNPTTKWNIGISDETHHCNSLYDLATNEEVGFFGIVTDDSKIQHNGEDWNSWGWCDISSDIDDEEEIEYAVLFKEAGKHQLKFSFQTGAVEDGAGDVGPIEFTFKKAYNGPGYGTSSVNDNAANSSVIYPNPSNGSFAVAEDGELTITNMVGEVVYTANVVAGSEINTGLAAGNYVASIKTAETVKVAKVVIK